MGVLGSTILPVPWCAQPDTCCGSTHSLLTESCRAFAKLGILPGVLVLALVAIVNDRTCCMLIRASSMTGKFGFEVRIQPTDHCMAAT